MGLPTYYDTATYASLPAHGFCAGGGKTFVQSYLWGMGRMFDPHLCRCENELSPAEGRQLAGIYELEGAAVQAAIDDPIAYGRTVVSTRAKVCP